MMMNTRINRLAIAVAGAVSLVASTAQAEDFTASATLQNTLTVVNVQNLDIGTVFATQTGDAALLADGVGALVISPAGAVTDPTVDSADVNLTSLTNPTPAQGSVEMAANFTLTLPDTSLILPGEFDGSAITSLPFISDGTHGATELVHESANPTVPSLYLMHFTVDAVSGGTRAVNTSNDGEFAITQSFGETTFVFNIGATLTTKPTSDTAEIYQEGVYSGTFEVTAAY